MPHTITFRPSGISIFANESETILQAARRQAVHLPSACRSGACYLCEGVLLSGKVQQNTIEKSYAPETPTVLCCTCIPHSDIDLEVKGVLAPGQLPIHDISAQITSIEQASPDVKVVKFRLPAGKPVTYYAGQYLEILLDENNSAAFSIANAPNSDRVLELHIREVSNSESYQLLAKKLTIGEILKLRLPMGGTTTFQLQHANRLILLAASTGFSQIKAILEAMIASEDKRPLHVYWGARNPKDLYLHNTMLDLIDGHDHIHYTPVISEPMAWKGRTGLVHKTVLEDIDDFTDYTIVCGGSPAMVYAAYDDFLTAGMKPEQMLSDVFSYAPRT